MSKRNDRDYRSNPTNRRGIVVDRDPKSMRVKVRFEDEDDTVTTWIDVVSKSSNGTSAFQMPGQDDEVWCAMDAKGEAGCLIGSRYNSKDAPPFTGNDDIGITFPGGSLHINQATGAFTLTLNGDVKITAANIVLESGTLTHNGKNVGHDHAHLNVLAGPDLTGPPS